MAQQSINCIEINYSSLAHPGCTAQISSWELLYFGKKCQLLREILCAFLLIYVANPSLSLASFAFFHALFSSLLFFHFVYLLRSLSFCLRPLALLTFPAPLTCFPFIHLLYSSVFHLYLLASYSFASPFSLLIPTSLASLFQPCLNQLLCTKSHF